MALVAFLDIQARPAPRFPISDALDQYDRGEYSELLETLDGIDLSRHFDAFEKQAGVWVRSGTDGSRWRRQIVAATVALEIAHRLRTQPPDHSGRYLAWASLLMRQEPGSPSETERLWHLACLATMLEQWSPWVLTVGLASGPTSELGQLAGKLGAGGQLATALRRFPTEARFRLMQAASTEWQLVGYRFVPSYIDLASRLALDRVAQEPRSTEELTARVVRDDARQLLREFTRLPTIVREYEALMGIPAVRAEAELRVGWLESSAMRWQSALDRFRRVPSLTDETYLEYLSHYFSGRVFQQLADHASARAAFERAIALIPNARSAATHLAVELLLTDRVTDHDRAYSLLVAAHSPAVPEDPWTLYFRADARLWPTYIAHLKQALR